MILMACLSLRRSSEAFDSVTHGAKTVKIGIFQQAATRLELALTSQCVQTAGVNSDQPGDTEAGLKCWRIQNSSVYLCLVLENITERIHTSL